MSEDSDSKRYLFTVLEDGGEAPGCMASAPCSSLPRGASGCSSMAQLHRMGGFSQGGPDLGLQSEGSDSSGQNPPASPLNHRHSARSRSPTEEDVEMKSSGSSGSGSESHGNDSHSHESVASSNGNSKDSALLESSESNKSSKSHSPSPPSSSNAFSLLSSEQDNPSTSGCSSEESAKAKTQKEVIKTLKELKLHLPAEKRHNNKSTTLSTLKYALRCVKQVEANEEYFQLLMINEGQPPGQEAPFYTIEEIDSVASEYTLQNDETFAVAVSVNTGRIVYISDQAASILNCSKDTFTTSKFVEFLKPRDVGVFYNSTSPSRLPSWKMHGSDSSPSRYVQDKSFFCRIRCGRAPEGDLQYLPFCLMPYMVNVLDPVHDEDKACCLLFTERVHSGYDAPRIPFDKEIFTTTHSSTCVFQDVDAKAVPFLGYLPQDLIGTPVLLHLHPNDRPIMLGIHRKIYQYAGQPIDPSSIRFCAQNGEYIVLDTSWSSFVNPWSNRISFVIGRHKVRTGPVNEDVFMTPNPAVVKPVDFNIQGISEQIHQVLLQPVHYSGYSSHPKTNNVFSLTSLSEGIGSRDKTQEHEEPSCSNARPRTFQEICKGIHLQKSQEQQTNEVDNKKSSSSIEAAERAPMVVRPKDSAAPLNPREYGAALEESRPSSQEKMASDDPTIFSYQQISCLDSVFRYLESCSAPVAMKRKCQSLSNTTSSNSDDSRQKEAPDMLKDQSGHSPLDVPDQKPSDAATAVVGTSLPHPVPGKPESVFSLTSQCSYSSTIVHVGDKKPQLDSEIIEDVPGTGETVQSSQGPSAPSSSVVSPPTQEREAYKKLGLTKQVLAAHTQKEEQAFLDRIGEVRGQSPLTATCSQYVERQREQIAINAAPTTRRGTRFTKKKSKQAKQLESSESTSSERRRLRRRQQQQFPRLNQGLNLTAWSPSDTSQSMPTPSMIQGFPLQDFSRTSSVAFSTPGCSNNQTPQDQAGPSSIQPPPFSTPMVAPIVLVLPNVMFPSLAGGMPPPLPVYHPDMPGFPMQMHPFSQAAFSSQFSFAASLPFNVPSQFSPQPRFLPQAGCLTPSTCLPPTTETAVAPVEGHSRSTTPQSGASGGPASPPLIQSSRSSPLNLLQLEPPVDRQDSTASPPGGQGNYMAEREKEASGARPNEKELKQASSRSSGNNSDFTSSSSGMMALLLQADACSATSESLGSGSNRCGTSKSRESASGTSGSGKRSTNSSRYYASVDSSLNSQKVESHSSSGEERPMQMDQSKKAGNHEPNPLWQYIANADKEVLMTYQLPSRDIQQVLQEDRDELEQLHEEQPCFSENQREELIEVHPWIQTGGLPEAIENQECFVCDGTSEAAAEVANQSDLDMVDAETWSVGDQRGPREDPTNAAANFGHVASAIPTQEDNQPGNNDMETSRDDAYCQHLQAHIWDCLLHM